MDQLTRTRMSTASSAPRLRLPTRVSEWQSVDLLNIARPFLFNRDIVAATQVCHAWHTRLHAGDLSQTCLQCDSMRPLPVCYLMDGAYYCSVCYSSSMRQFAEYHKKTRTRPPTQPDRIDQHVYIGDEDSGRSLEQLKRLGIERVIIAGRRLYAQHHADAGIQYLELQIDDSLVENIQVHLTDCIKFIQGNHPSSINHQLNSSAATSSSTVTSVDKQTTTSPFNGATLIHCASGISRSGAIVLAYLISTYQLTVAEALVRARQSRPRIKPNLNFMTQLHNYEARIRANGANAGE